MLYPASPCKIQRKIYMMREYSDMGRCVTEWLPAEREVLGLSPDGASLFLLRSIKLLSSFTTVLSSATREISYITQEVMRGLV